jgi:uncharacterized protein YndB with AHSA1/START domain
MSTPLLSPEEALKANRDAESTRVCEREITLQATLHADRRRIFDALTTPEYMETWLSLPGDHSHCRTLASRSNDEFHLDHFGERALDFSISGAYKACRRGKVLFTWRKDTVACSEPEGLVSIRLHGEFAQSTLLLTHSGAFSERDYNWTRDLWTLSLKKLQILFAIR